jgi:thymidylate synthase
MQLEREPRELPTLEIAQKPINELKFEDFQLKDYNPHESIRFKVAV